MIPVTLLLVRWAYRPHVRSPARLTAAAAATTIGLLGPATPAAAHQASPQQWTLDAQHFDSAKIWKLSTGRDVTVAVVDSGVDPNHPDLVGRVLPGADFTGTAADGRIDISANAHGTSVAGIIAGAGSGDDSVSGLAPDATILPVRTSTNLTSDPAALAQGIDYAVTHGAEVINVSLCTPNLNPQIRAAIDEAIQHDIIVVAAAGNDGLAGNPSQYPAALPGVIAVAASDTTGALWPKSESGSYLGLTAPGVDIYTTGAQGSRINATGTSFAAPQVAAAAALLRARYPTETANQIINRLTTTAHHTNGERTPQTGYGIIDPYQALTLPPPPATLSNPLLHPASPTAAPQAGKRAHYPGILITAVAAVLAAVAALAAILLIRRRRAATTRR